MKAVVESNKIFDANWDAETGEMHESVRSVLEKDANALFFMIQRSFSSGLTYSKTEATYLGCLVKLLRKRSLRPFLEILGRGGVAAEDEVETKNLLATLFLAIDFQDGQLIVSQHLNEITVERMKVPIKRHLAGEKRRAALQLVADYHESLSALTRRVEALGRLINGHFDDKSDL
mmetsp:Transcript_12275/g.34800  ORF Transcript_12275/g.34800 Transcript_12275/m.34800 type:complete len:175 (+) Transcript_12275:149-673(+)